MTSRIRRINLFGGPGCGKTTNAMLLTGIMKWHGINAAYVHEYVKDWAYRGDRILPHDQAFILAQQVQLETNRLEGGILRTVSDSPTWLSLFYAKKNRLIDTDKIRESCVWHTNQYPELNLFLSRSKTYDPVGRYQTEEEARRIDGELETFFVEERISFIRYSGTESFSDIFYFATAKLRQLEETNGEN